MTLTFTSFVVTFSHGQTFHEIHQEFKQKQTSNISKSLLLFLVESLAMTSVCWTRWRAAWRRCPSVAITRDVVMVISCSSWMMGCVQAMWPVWTGPNSEPVWRRRASLSKPADPIFVTSGRPAQVKTNQMFIHSFICSSTFHTADRPKGVYSRFQFQFFWLTHFFFNSSPY